MARTDVTVEQIDRDDVEEGTDTALIADGHKFLNDGKMTFLEIENGVTEFTLTVQVAKTVDGQAVTNQTYTVGASKDYMLGPFPADIYNQSDGKVYVDYSEVSDGTVTPWRLGI